MADTLVGLVRERAQAGGDGHAYGFLVDGEQDLRSMTYGELEQRAAAIGALLGERVAPGGRVLLVFEPGLDFLAAFFGCLFAGVVAVPVYPPAPARPDAGLASVARVAADCGAEAVLASPLTVALAEVAAGLDALRGLPWLVPDGRPADAWRAPRVRPDTVAMLQYTSGSTGSPKGVVLRHRHLLGNLASMDWFTGRPATGTVVSWLPLYHDMGLIGTVLYPLFRGMPCYLMSPMHFLHRPLRWLELISRVGGTISGGPSFAYYLCTRRADAIPQDRLDLSSWEVAFNGAEPINPDVARAFEAAFAPSGLRPGTVVGCYGLAEASLIVTGARRGEPRFAHVLRGELGEGKAVECDSADPRAVELADAGGLPPDHDVRIVDPGSGRELPDGVVGEIWVAAPGVADGYWRKPEETRAAFGARLPATDAGYLRTGDLGVLRDGRLFVTGRRKDVVIVRGRNVYPHDIERVAQQVDRRLRPGGGVAFSIQGADGEGVALLQEVTTRDPEELRTLAAAIAGAVLADQQVPISRLYLVPPRSVLKTSSGKPRRSATRDALHNGDITILHTDGDIS
ncbi:fatty acyl-AMP ligase [Nonomuraea sp. NPDC003754]